MSDSGHNYAYYTMTTLSTQSHPRSYALLGLTFNAITMTETKTLIRQAITTQQQLIFATPNVNFIALAAKDRDFRQSVLACDLNIVDGMPLYWLAQWIGLPLPERVAGSSLIDSLISDSNEEPIKVFFFGGQEDTAAIASEKLNATAGGLTSVGALNPGFGSVESMSDSATIEQINQANPDFLIISLGAKKGHQWIHANKDQLNARVISHLGAVVNFVAGSQQRSPLILQKLGLEWLWRIYQEPALYKRYSGDALSLAAQCLKSYMPQFFTQLTRSDSPCSIDYQESSNSTTIKISGSLKAPLPEQILQHLNTLTLGSDHRLIFDFEQTKYIGSELIASILQLTAKYPEQRSNLMLINIPTHITSALICQGVEV
jgi:N-acetylglucosaminyldiphosphoundecaprenol N-acetyl-beta-D-mannosaminyltransferase